MPRPPGSDSSSTTARRPLRQLPETMSGGVGLLDYDGDGWLDVYCVQGGPLSPPDPTQAGDGRPPLPQHGATARSRTSPSGPAWPRSPGATATASTVGDFDNDGHPDLFVTRLALLRPVSQPGRRHVRGRHRGGRPGRRPGLTRPRPPSPTWTTTATSTSMSATTCSGTPRIPRLCRSDKGDYSTATRARSSPAPTTSSATTAAGSWT